MMRIAAMTALLLFALATTACNTLRGAGQDARSVGRVFSDHPDRKN